MAPKMTLSTIQKLLVFSKMRGHDKILKDMIATGFENNVLRVEFPVTIDTLNTQGGLHGGFTATVVDVANICTMLANGVDGAPGVTVDLHVSYMKGAKEGDVVVVESRPIKQSGNMAFLECELRHKSDGAIIARGIQTNMLTPNLAKTDTS